MAAVFHYIMFISVTGVETEPPDTRTLVGGTKKSSSLARITRSGVATRAQVSDARMSIVRSRVMFSMWMCSVVGEVGEVMVAISACIASSLEAPSQG